MGGLKWCIIREDADGTERDVEEHFSKAKAQSRLDYFRSLGDGWYYIEAR